MAVSLSDIITYKRLVTCGNDEVWYEMSAGTMIELDTSSGAINTSDQLNMFEAFQKVFIVNGANLKVADFINTKLTHTELTIPHAHGDILEQDQAGDDDFAYMVVDSTNAAKTETYGYAYYDGTTTAFNTTVAIATTGSGTVFTPSDVADLTNAKLTHVAIGTAHAKGDILTGQTSEATMTVEHTNTAKTATYGAVTSGTFTVGEVIKGDGDGSDITLTTVTLPTPHWYDYVVHPNDVAINKLPNKAYLGCLYRGRVVLSGDPEHPFQWYMARQGNPFDLAYVANDAGSPIKGGNADMGELGDIIRCLIPYKDDYLIFGCATSIWFAAGDPAAGGSINELDLTTGIFGANSWCWDGAGNLYFWGTNGLYKTTIPGTPICLSAIALPDLIKERAANPSSHRITMEYDRKDYGIHICITLLEDGSNYNYWYDLKTEGFFPETYLNECGAYSLFYYAANNTGYRDLLVGCKDGYIRKFDKTAKSDVKSDDSAQLIDSYVVLGPIQLSRVRSVKDGIISNIDIVSAGGEATGGATEESDSDDIDYSVYTARTSENIIEDANAGAPKIFGTFSSPGLRRGNRDRRKIRGRFGAIKLGNSTADKSWGFEKLIIDIRQIGKVL